MNHSLLILYAQLVNVFLDKPIDMGPLLSWWLEGEWFFLVARQLRLDYNSKATSYTVSARAIPFPFVCAH